MPSSTKISFEFFPPRDRQGREKLVQNVASKLDELGPEFFSVTYGAGGSTRDGTAQTVADLLVAGRQAAPHLSMGNDGADDIVSMLDDFASLGVQRIVVLRGDQPSGLGSSRFDNNAEALVRLIRLHSGDRFKLMVAAYPEVHPDGSSAAKDFVYFQQKVAAGADAAITQYFYNADAYARFVDRCEAANLGIPIIAGVMPITNTESLTRFSEKAGAEIPRWLRFSLLDKQHNEADLIDYGVEVVTKLCEQLTAMGAPGFHFYTLNRWGATTRICRNLGLG